MTTGVLVLAAGGAARFGADKRRALMPDGRSVLDTTLANISAAGLPLLVCLGANDHALARQLHERAIPCQRCARAGEGMGATLAEGAGYLAPWSGVLVALADMPWIASATYQLLAQRLSPQSIVVPVYNGQRGHPVGFGRAFYPELAELGGDTGARRLLLEHAGLVTEVPLADAAILRDIDVPADLSLS
jgi:molybdenum cofactor cytidylyltransferase